MPDSDARANLGLYGLLSWRRAPKTFLGKVVLVTFAGTHVPMIAFILYVLFITSGRLSAHLGALAVLLAATVAGFAATFWALRSLLAPLRLTSSSLKAYLDSGELPDLPIGFRDEAGRLMADVAYAADRMDSTIRELEAISGTDHLTGLPNRRRAERRLAEYAATVAREGGTLTLGVADVNRFKGINDSFGHQAGDACLRHVALVMRDNVRQGDWVARWAGDEFIIVMRDASPFAPTEDVLQKIAEALRNNPAKLPDGEELALGVTVGAVRYAGDTGAKSGPDLEKLLAKADAAMYEAKREGRPWVLAM